MLDVFSGIEVSYKTIERLYSEELVMMALHNLHIILLKKKGMKQSDTSGDGTGYSPTIKKNYESYTKELKEKAKENREESEKQEQKDEKAKKASFAYSFRLMDLSTKMYVAWGSSMKSEKDALLKTADVELKNVRLDKYYSKSAYIDYFDKETKVYVLPKKNSTLKWFIEVEGYNERICAEHNELSAGILQEGELRSWILSRQEDVRLGYSSEQGGHDRRRFILHWPVTQPVLPEFIE